jgi:hypothetical protein
MAVSGVAVAVGTAGIVLLWSAIENQKITTTIQDIVKGKKPTPGPTTTTVPTAAASTGSAIQQGANIIASQGHNASANQAIALLLAAPYGWAGGANWAALKAGWQEESGWNQFAANDPADPYNHAYGIPQSNPGTKMASAGSDWQTSPSTQIRWGLNYIKQTYGSPSQVPGWTPNGVAAGYVGY